MSGTPLPALPEDFEPTRATLHVYAHAVPMLCWLSPAGPAHALCEASL